jgi:hypothetical protein
MRHTMLAPAFATTLVLGGCAGGAEEAEAKTAISDYLVAQQEEAQMIPLDQDEADCIAGGMVDGIGVDRLQEYGLLDEDGSINESTRTPEMSRDDAKVMVDAMFDCTEVMQEMRNQLATVMGEQTPKVRGCLQEAMDEELVRSVLVATFSGEETQAQQQMMGSLGGCLTGGTDLHEDN